MTKEELEKEADESCPDCFCEDCTKDCEIKKLGLVETKEIIKGLLSLKSTISSAQDAENRFSVREKAEEFLKECQ